MLLQFTVSNFRAFRETQTLNLAASNYDKTLPENRIDIELPGLKGQRWLKGVALYGPNAGGKSSVLDALKALADLVTNSAATTDPKSRIRQVQPFALAPNEPTPPTGFGVVFSTNGVRYEYRVAATTERVIHESLRAFPHAKEQLWFSRDWQEESQVYSWTPEGPTGYHRDPALERFTLPNVLFLSKAISLGDTQLEPLFRWFMDGVQFMDRSAKTDARILVERTAQQVLDEPPLGSKILELFKHADLGIDSAQVYKEGDPKKTWMLIGSLPSGKTSKYSIKDIEKLTSTAKVQLTHKGREAAAIPLSWESESAGTQQLFGLAGSLLDMLEKGQTVFIDEIDSSMHPLMVMELLRLVFSAETNKTGAQLIFTTHNPLLLDPTLLRRDQVWFTDKDEHGEAHLYPLTDYAPRKGESLVRGYLSGRYGAVPFIPEGLLGTFRQAKGGKGDK